MLPLRAKASLVQRERFTDYGSGLWEGVIFWCEGCLLYRCLLPLALVWASHYPLEEGIQMQLLVPSHGVLSSGGGSYMPLEHAMGTEAACDCTGSPEGQNHWLETCPEAQRRAVVVAHNHL